MIIPNPNNGGRWKTSYAGDKFGDLVQTYNLDFNKEGSMQLARKPMCLYTNSDDEDFDQPVAIAALDGTYFVVTTDGTFSFSISNGSLSFSQLTTSSAPTEFAGSDAVPYLDALAVSGTTTVVSYSVGGGAWTERTTGLSSSYPHPMAVSPSLRTLFVASQNTVYQTTAGTWTDDSSNRLTIPAEYIITSLRWRGNDLYIGTRHQDGGEAVMYVWNGSGTQAQSVFSAGADWIYSMCEYDASIALLTSEGQLLRYNGGGFDVLANLPIYYTPYSWYSSTATTGYGKCINRGMAAVGNIIYMNLDGSTNPGTDYLPTMPSGLWVYDPAVGLYHKGGYNISKYDTITVSSLNSSILTMGSAHGAADGDPVFGTSVTNITGLANKTYYAIVESSTALKLALSRTDALAGRHITISGTPSGDTLSFENIDYIGDLYDIDPGPVFPFVKSQPNLFFGSEVFYAGRATDDNVTTIMSLGSGNNVGFGVTGKMYSREIEDAVQSLYLKVKPLVRDSDEIILKYRTTERPGLEAPDGIDITWVNSTSFTAAFGSQNIRDAQVGDEVMVIKGKGAGYIRRITAISEGASTWTITIDEAVPNISVSDTATVIIENWTELETLTADTTDQGITKTPLENKSGWFQSKVELRGNSPEIAEMQIASTVHKPTT